MTSTIRSWLQELVDKYNDILALNPVEDLDEANEVICKAIQKLDEINRSRNRET